MDPGIYRRKRNKKRTDPAGQPKVGKTRGRKTKTKRQGFLGISSARKKIRPQPSSMKDVWFRYEKDSPDVIQDLSLEVKKGEFYALGRGKRTGKRYHLIFTWTSTPAVQRQNLPGWKGSSFLFRPGVIRWVSWCYATESPEHLFKKDGTRRPL